jgi:hypothetical protein
VVASLETLEEQAMSELCVLRKGIFDRWVIFHPARTITKAWSGSQWVDCTTDGVPYGIQVCNFLTEQEARDYCSEHDLRPV